jgi:hypothetical protein
VFHLETCYATPFFAVWLQSGIRNTHLALLRSPLSIGIPVVDNLVTARIPDFCSGVTESTIGRPRDLVAGRFSDEEWLGAVLLAVVIDAFLDVVVEDRAVCNSGS